MGVPNRVSSEYNYVPTLFLGHSGTAPLNVLSCDGDAIVKYNGGPGLLDSIVTENGKRDVNNGFEFSRQFRLNGLEASSPPSSISWIGIY